MMSKPITILIVDDFAVVRAGLRALLESEVDMHVVGEAANGETAVLQTRLLDPGVILLDMVLPDFDGLTVIRAIRLEKPELPILVLSNYGETERVQAALNAGATRYLLKDRHFEKVVKTVRDMWADKTTPRHLT